MNRNTESEAAEAGVRGNTEEVQGKGNFGIAPHQKIHCEAVDVMRVHDGKVDHWGVGNLLYPIQQIGGWTPSGSDRMR